MEITCVASNADPNGKFVWMIGDEVLPLMEDKIHEEENEFKQTYKIVPQVNFDKKDLTCKFVLQNESGEIVSEAEDVLNVRVSYAKFPQDKIDAGEYSEGSPVELAVEFGMYPQPDENDLLWLIEDAANEWNDIIVRIGEVQFRT